MKKPLFILVFTCFMAVNAQVGINTNNPDATLHLEPSDPDSPTGRDGILIPKLSDFPTSQAKGQTIFLENHTSLPNGFYYWDGSDWNSYIIDAFDRSVDQSIYVVTGEGYSGTGGVTERNVFFNTLRANNTSGFSVSGNTITIGRTGKYLVSFNSAFKKNYSAPAYRALYTYRIKRGGSTILTASNSIPNENVTATSVALSGLVELNAGDVINVTVQKNNEGHSDNNYTGYGTNCLTFTYLND